MSKIKHMLTDKKFWFFMLIAILFFGLLVKMEYATDTYAVFENQPKEMFRHFISSGRFITAFAYAIATLLHMQNQLVYILSFILAIVCTAISVYKLEKIFSKDIKVQYISVIAAISIIINIFSIELYLFIEKGILMLSVLFSICALEKLISYFEGNKKALFGVFIYMLLANFSYQGTVGIFVAIALLYILKYTKDIKSFVINTITTAFCYGIPAIINYIIVRFVFSNTRVNGTINFMQSIGKIITDTKYMITTTYDIIPKYLFMTLFAIISILVVLCIIRGNIEDKKKKWLILGLAYVIIGNIVVTIFPQLMQSTESIWFVPRSTYTFASLIGILIVYLFMNVKVDIKLEKILMISIVIYMCIQYIGFENIIRDRYTLNYMDYYISMQIQEKINKYEEETKNEITKVAFYSNDEKQYSYLNLHVNRDTNIKAFYPDWARLNAINYYLNRNFEQVEKTDEIEQRYFKDKTWKFYSDEQVILIEDTLHLYIY